MTVALCLTFFAAVAIINWLILARNRIRGTHSSMLFVLGGLWGAIAFFILPSLRAYFWLPLLLDPATAVLLFVGLPRAASDSWSTSRINLVGFYEASDFARSISLRLYRRGIFVLEQHFTRPPGLPGPVHFSTIGTWQRDNDSVVLILGGECLILTAEPGKANHLQALPGHSQWAHGSELSLSGVSLKLRAA